VKPFAISGGTSSAGVLTLPLLLRLRHSRQERTAIIINNHTPIPTDIPTTLCSRRTGSGKGTGSEVDAPVTPLRALLALPRPVPRGESVTVVVNVVAKPVGEENWATEVSAPGNVVWPGSSDSDENTVGEGLLIVEIGDSPGPESVGFVDPPVWEFDDSATIPEVAVDVCKLAAGSEKGGYPPYCAGIVLGDELVDGWGSSKLILAVSFGPLALVKEGTATSGNLLHVLCAELGMSRERMQSTIRDRKLGR
jgi:hypothetical protein